MISKRYELWILLFTGFVVFMDLTLNLPMAIVAMAKPNTHNNNNTRQIVSQCRINNNVSIDTDVKFTSSSSTNQYNWSNADKSLILGSGFWSTGIAAFIGGIWSQKYGGKIVFGYSIFIGGLLNFFIPLAADLGLQWLVTIRIIQGFVVYLGGGNIMSYFLARWVPQNERSKFSSALSGFFIGSAFSFFLNGCIMHFLDWRYVFHVGGIFSTLWSLIWYFAVYDNPEEHPRISKSELTLIKESIGDKLSKKSLSIPWIRILTSIPVILNTLLECISWWIAVTVITFTPTYLATIHGLPYYQLGVFSSLPELLKTFVSVGFAFVIDAIIKRKYLTVTNSRKFAVIIGFIIGGSTYGFLSLVECNLTVALIIITSASSLSGSHVSIIFPNLAELSPNFSAPIRGIQGLISNSLAIFSPMTVAYFTDRYEGTAGWNRVFIILMLLSEVAGLLYLIFGSSELQSWNTERTTDVASNRKLTETHDEKSTEASELVNMNDRR